MRIRRLAIVLLLLLSLAPRALGDSAPMASVGPNVEPMNSTTVRLAEERIEIHLSRGLPHAPHDLWSATGHFRIWFRFEPAVDEEMTVGFPLFVIDPAQAIYGGQIQDLRVEVDGQEVQVQTRSSAYGKRNPEADPADWAVYPVTFRAGQPLEMVVSYSMPVYPYGKGPDAPLWVSYVLRTGAYWAGTIGRAEAVVSMDKPIRPEDIRSSDDRPWRATTPGWTLEDGALRWVWEDVEPDFDLHLVMENAYWLDLQQDLRAMLEAGLGDRDAVLRALSGVGVLLSGGRDGQPLALRDGVMSDEAAEALLPEVLLAAASYLAEHPDDRTVREAYVGLLYTSPVQGRLEGGEWVMALRSEERLVSALAELTRLARERLLPGYLRYWRPWTDAGLRDHPWQPETREAIAAFLAAMMPPSFATAADAEDWVAANAGNALSADQAAELLSLATARVRTPAPAAGETSGAATGGAGERGATGIGSAAEEVTSGGTPADDPVAGEGEDAGESGGHIGVAMLTAGLCLTLGAAVAFTLWAWRSARRRERRTAG